MTLVNETYKPQDLPGSMSALMRERYLKHALNQGKKLTPISSPKPNPATVYGNKNAQPVKLLSKKHTVSGVNSQSTPTMQDTNNDNNNKPNRREHDTVKQSQNKMYYDWSNSKLYNSEQVKCIFNINYSINIIPNFKII